MGLSRDSYRHAPAPKQVIVDLGYRGVDADNPGVQIIHRGKYKSLSNHDKRLLKRRQFIEPLIGHTKADHRMDRCWLQGALGDALHALCCAAGYNIRWLLRAIARLGVDCTFCVLNFADWCLAIKAASSAFCGPKPSTTAPLGLGQRVAVVNARFGHGWVNFAGPTIESALQNADDLRECWLCGVMPIARTPGIDSN